MKVKMTALVLLSLGCSGCASMLLGIKSYETKESRTEFITGYDFGVGINGIDTVKNERGIKANGQEKGAQSNAKDGSR